VKKAKKKVKKKAKKKKAKKKKRKKKLLPQEKEAQFYKALGAVDWRLNLFSESGYCSIVSTRGAKLPKALKIKGHSKRLGDDAFFMCQTDFVELVASHRRFGELVKQHHLRVRCNYQLEAVEQNILLLHRRRLLIAAVSDGKWNNSLDRDYVRLSPFARGVDFALLTQGTSIGEVAAKQGISKRQLVQKLFKVVKKAL
jgi:hypothetical protein